MAPDVSKLSKAALETIRPVKLHYDSYSFDMTMSDGATYAGTGFSPWNKCTLELDLPQKLSRVDVIFFKTESHIHSINFHGDRVVTTAYTNEVLSMMNYPDDQLAGRVETITLKPGEELLGAKFHHDTAHTYGITWIIRRTKTR